MEGYSFIASACLTVALIDELNIKPTRWVRVEISHNPVCGNIASTFADRSRALLFQFSSEAPREGPGLVAAHRPRGARKRRRKWREAIVLQGRAMGIDAQVRCSPPPKLDHPGLERRGARLFTFTRP